VFVAGVNLSLVTFIALTELPSLLGSNELVALFVLGAYFLGLSGGYLLSDKLGRRGLLVLAGATLALHATLPFSARWLAGTMWRAGHPGITPPFVFFLVLLGITPFYAVFLPRLIDARSAASSGGEATRGRDLVPLYATELAGSAVGLGLSVVLTPARMGAILTLHLVGIAAILVGCAGPRKKLLTGLLLPLPLVYGALFPTLDRASLEYFYRHRWGFREVALLASEFSAYQRIDIVEGLRSRGRSRYLYLNGNLNYGSTELNQHNLFVCILPNLLVAHPSNALVIAGGSLDNARYLAPLAGKVTVVEIDEAVVRLSREHIQAARGGFPTGWDLVIDDGKHFLGNWEGPRFDVISVDVPMPSFLALASLHSDRFFALARTRLAPGGIFSISLYGDLSPPEPDYPFPDFLSQRVLAGLLRNFRHVVVTEVDGSGYAWASDAPLEVNAGMLREKIDGFARGGGAGGAFGAPAVRVLGDAEVRAGAAGHEAIGEADMQLVLRISASKLYDRFYAPPQSP
jgi:predicted membrane-bound spermidine synthase